MVLSLPVISTQVSCRICFLLSFIWVLFLEMFSHSVLTLSCVLVTVMSMIQTRKGKLRESRQLVLSTQVGPASQRMKPKLTSQQGFGPTLFLSDPKASFLLSPSDPLVGTPYQVSGAHCKTPGPELGSSWWNASVSPPFVKDTNVQADMSQLIYWHNRHHSKELARITHQNCEFERIRNILWKHISFWV